MRHWPIQLIPFLCFVSGPRISAAPAPVLYYFQKTTKGCEWKVHHLSETATSTYLTTSDCPSDAAFDFDHAHVYFRSGNTIRKANWKQGTTESAQIRDLGSVKFGHIWIDSTTNRLRVAYVKPPRLKCQGEISEYEFGWMCDGKPLASVGQLTVDEWSGKAWSHVATKKAAPSDMDTLGLRSLRSEIKSSAKNFSLRCFEGHGIYSIDVGCAAPPLPKPSVDQLIKIDAKVGKSGRARVLAGENCPLVTTVECDVTGDFLAFIPVGANDGLLVDTTVGDNLHLNAPVYYCENLCQKRTPVSEFKNEEEVSASVRGDYVLLQSEKLFAIWRSGNAIPVLKEDAIFAFLAE